MSAPIPQDQETKLEPDPEPEVDPNLFSSKPQYELLLTGPPPRSGVPVEEKEAMTPSTPLAGATAKRKRGPAKAVELTGERKSRKSKRIRGVKLSYSKDIDADAPIMGLLTTMMDLKPETAYAKPEWREAMELHLENLTNLNVFTPVKKPKGKTIIKARWVYAKKGDKPPFKYKARYVGKGFMQVQGRDYESTWSPTVRLASLHVLMALAAQQGRLVFQFDVKDAYLTADLLVTLYVQAPSQFFGKDMVWLLHKALPGLKQSGQAWYRKLSKVLAELGYHQCKMDPCVFTKTTPDGKTLMMGVHVDDGLLVCDTVKQKDDLFKAMNKHFGVKDMGFPTSLREAPRRHRNAPGGVYQ